MRRALTVFFVLGLAIAAMGDSTEALNGGFEVPGDAGLPKGWVTFQSAATSDAGPASRIAVVDAPDGVGKCLHFVSERDATRWMSLRQPVAVRSGEFIRLQLRARSRGIDWSGSRFVNAVGALFFESADGAALGFAATPTLSGDREWVELNAYGVVPEGATRAQVQVVLTMPGELWVDDVRVESTPLEPWTAEARTAVVEGLTRHLQRSYPFRGVEGRAAEDAFTTDRAALLGAETHDAFAEALVVWLARLNDPHVYVRTPRGVIGPMSKLPAPAWNFRAVLTTLQGWDKVAHGRNVLALRKDDRAYLLVATFQLNADDRRLLAQAVRALRDAERLIVDVRPNSGGDEVLARTILAPYAQGPTPYAHQRSKDWSSLDPEAFTAQGTRVLQPAPEEARSKARVVVLQGPHCMSSTDAFLLMAKALPRVTTMGRASFGASANPRPFQLLPELTVWASTWRAYDLDGECIEGRGVVPDIEVEPGPKEEWAKRDRVLEAALKALEAD